MSLLLDELLEKLKELDEVLLLETLGINSEMLLDRFLDLVEEKRDFLEEEFNDEHPEI